MKALLLSLVLLTGCSTVVPVAQKAWPEPPGLQSTQACAPLQQLPDNPPLSQVAKTVTQNYTEYWNCAIKLDAWIEWYGKQKLINEGLK